MITDHLYISSKETMFGVLKGSTLGPLFFKIFLCNLLLIMKNIDIASYADGNTSYTTRNSIEEVIQKLESAAKTFFQGFSDNQMKADPDKCHFVCSSNSEVSLIIGPLLFNIFLCDLFLIMKNIDIASYADDNTSYTTGNSIEEVIQKLENAAKTLVQGFSITK